MTPRSLVRAGVGAAAALVAAAGIAHAQVSIPNIQNPINKARAAAEKTSDQIRNAEKVGGAGGKVSGATGQAAAAQAVDQQKRASVVAQKTAPQAAGKAAPRQGVTPDSAAMQPSTRRNTVAIYREAFAYDAGGRRDPFISLMLSGELRPIITDLSLTGVIYDPEGRRSIALLVDASTGEAYRVRVGQSLARMKVTRIGMQDITFSIDEFGLSRSETLIIDRTKKAGAPAPRRP